MKFVNTFLIGADPEFAAINKAGEHVNVKPFTSKEAEVAWDHEGDVLEVKPKPSKYAFRVLRRIQRLLLQHEVSKSLINSGYRLRAGGYIKTPRRSLGLGGHIHFDIPYENGVSHLAPSLNRLTEYLEALDILPKLDSGKRHRYLVIEDYRRANNADRFEYRRMCSWLHSPISAYICLTAAKITAAYPKECLVDSNVSVDALHAWFEKFKHKDLDAARVVERVFESKLKLEANLDLNLQDAWKSLKKLGGLGSHEFSSAL